MKPAERFKVYAKLLYLYPSGYRKEYGEQLLQTVADMVDDASSSSERRKVWLQISLDFAVTVYKEYMQLIGENMSTKTTNGIRRQSFVSAALLLLPIALLVINRLLMLSGPGRGVPTIMLLMFTVPLPFMAVLISGNALYGLLHDSNKSSANTLRQAWPLAVVCVLSLLLLLEVMQDILTTKNI